MWPFKKKNTKPKIPSHLPSFLVEIEDNGNIIISAQWPRAKDADDIAHIVKGYIGTLLLLREGTLAPIFQQAISIYAHNHNDVETGNAVLLGYAERVNRSNPHDEDDEDDDEPIVKPSEAFNRE